MSNVLTVRNLNAEYRIPDGTRKVLSDVSLEIEEGRILAIVGESGCGKSTLVNCVGMLLPDNARITSGEILLDGRSVIDLGSNTRKH